MSLRGCAGALVLALGMGLVLPAMAHPMPNTEIGISLSSNAAHFDIAVPTPELRLALPQNWAKDADLLAEPQRSFVTRYFSDHFSVSSGAGAPLALALEDITRWQRSDPDVGLYEELRLRFSAHATQAFDPLEFTLRYDAVIHQVPNHFALVYTSKGGRTAEIGAIRYDFSRDITPPLRITVEAGGLWRGLRSMAALGFHHVISGLDHVLFLLTLLVVAPLRRIGGRWSLFQGWRYTAQRFFAISLAFTAGHSVALLLGTYEVVPVPRKAIEVLIAGSILITAIHGIRPVSSGREWLIAGGFGTIHGLAFSESLSGLVLSASTRALTVFGFNIGIEGAQLVAMACAVPLLYASRWTWFHGARVAAMTGTAAIACWWMVIRLLDPGIAG
jgi:hypothetical protein